MSGRKIALLSVSDKTGLLPFAQGLVEHGFSLVSTGGTLRYLQEGGLAVIPVDEVTGFPEILGGRVKTLHPAIHGGILAVRGDQEHKEQLRAHDISPIDLVCVNLYPFEETVSRPDSTWQDAIENIDIGGPTLLRAAAKNHEHVIVVCDPNDYTAVLASLDGSDKHHGIGPTLRRTLAYRAFQHTAAYDGAIQAWLAPRLAGDDAAEAAPGAGAGGSGVAGTVGAAGGAGGAGVSPEGLPEAVTLSLRKLYDLRYGENPHQQAAFYALGEAEGAPTIAAAEQLGGKQLSFNNINDADAALRLVLEFGAPAAVAIKHTNPCGVGIGPDLATAFDRAFRADDVSIFGGIVAFNRRVDGATANLLASIFLEVIIAPDYDEDALAILQRKRDLRILRTGFWAGVDGDDSVVSRVAGMLGAEAGDTNSAATVIDSFDYKRVAGGLLIQSTDPLGLERNSWKVVTTATPADDLWRQLELAWLVCKHVKSNAIVLAKDDMTVGVGAGQTNRIDATRHAIVRAAQVKGNPEGARGAVLASDAFFPFPDVVEAAIEAGITAIVQPGGSVRDSASIEAANKAGIAMVFTGKRHFKH